MAKVFELLAEGFEEIEALMPVDVLRRGGVDVLTVSISSERAVKGAHGVVVEADFVFDEADFESADMLLLPGGMPGAANLDAHTGVRKLLTDHANKGKRIGAICAAPMVLGRLGLLKGRDATCYPGFEKYLEGANATGELYVIDGNIITGKGPAAAFNYSLAILSLLCGDQVAEQVGLGMGSNWL